ncbi:VOC family protein [Paenibacillus albus]|uniref:VOC family protein n=1 Tax=Paenibacillus albus TaxID=2495582 RepID=A0A3Q8X1J6_9BACL|nr:VOC family protein [Paenibacillus albus]AZN38332.1 VOC family protein [Paenibacillus albus]
MTVKLEPYLMMDGNTKDAIEFYKEALGAEVLFLQTFGEMPENPEFPLPEEAKGLVGHAMVRVGETDLMFSDNFPGTPFAVGNQVTICISSTDIERSRQIYEALPVGGQVHMPLTETFFSPAYAVLTDKFGVTWQVYTHANK